MSGAISSASGGALPLGHRVPGTRVVINPAMDATCRLEAGVHGFRYLKSDTVKLDNVDEAHELRNTIDAMNTVGLTGAEQASLR